MPSSSYKTLTHQRSACRSTAKWLATASISLKLVSMTPRYCPLRLTSGYRNTRHTHLDPTNTIGSLHRSLHRPRRAISQLLLPRAHTSLVSVRTSCLCFVDPEHERRQHRNAVDRTWNTSYSGLCGCRSASRLRAASIHLSALSTVGRLRCKQACCRERRTKSRHLKANQVRLRCVGKGCEARRAGGGQLVY